MKNRTLTISLVFILMAFNYIKCTPKYKKNQTTHSKINRKARKTKHPVATLNKAIDTHTPKNQKELKTTTLMEETFKDAIAMAFIGFEDLKNSYDNVLAAFEYIGVEPTEDETIIDEKYIIGQKSVNGLRYFTARYENLGYEPQFISFELEPFHKAFDYAKKLITKFYPNLNEPCYESMNNNVAFKSKDGKYIISIDKITADNIDLDSMNPPRLLEDIDSVVISIRKNNNHHGNACADYPTHNSH